MAGAMAVRRAHEAAIDKANASDSQRSHRRFSESSRSNYSFHRHDAYDACDEKTRQHSPHEAHHGVYLDGIEPSPCNSPVLRVSASQITVCKRPSKRVEIRRTRTFLQRLRVKRGESSPLKVPTKVRFQEPPAPYRRRSSVRVGRRRRASLTLSDTIAIKKLRARYKAWWVIDPRNSKNLPVWDGLTSLALIFTAIVTPFETSFLPPPTMDTLDALFYVNRVVDFIFFVDMILQFCLCFPDFVSVLEGPSWVEDPAKIARHYLRGWFTVDFISVLPFDVISLVDSSGVLVRFKALRVIRLLRLLKMVRLLRASRMINRWRTKISIYTGTQTLGKCVASVLIWCHWVACAWMLQTTFYDDLVSTWLGPPLDFCWPYPEAALDEDPWQCVPVWELYVVCMYFSMYSITSVGFGDVVPVRAGERIVCVIVILGAGVVWGLVIATFAGVYATMDPQATQFNNTMDDLNRFMSLYGFDSELRQKLREYFYQTKYVQLTHTKHRLLALMSPTLRGNVAIRCNSWLTKIWFFKEAEREFLVQAALAVEPIVYAPTELVPPGCLYIIHRGMAVYEGRVLTLGCVWGDDMIMQSSHLRKRYYASAVSYLELFYLERSRLFEVAADFPVTAKYLRKCAIKLALRREVVAVAKALKQMKSPAAVRLARRWSSRYAMTRQSSMEDCGYELGGAPRSDEPADPNGQPSVLKEVRGLAKSMDCVPSLEAKVAHIDDLLQRQAYGLVKVGATVSGIQETLQAQMVGLHKVEDSMSRMDEKLKQLLSFVSRQESIQMLYL